MIQNDPEAVAWLEKHYQPVPATRHCAAISLISGPNNGQVMLVLPVNRAKELVGNYSGWAMLYE